MAIKQIYTGQGIPKLQELGKNGALNFLLDASGIGLFLVAHDHSLLDVSEALCSMLGYVKDELIGRKIDEFSHPDDIEKTRDFISSRSTDDEMLYPLEKRYSTRDGGFFWARVRIEEIRNEQGELICDLVMVENISEIKAKEESLRIANAISMDNRESIHRILASLPDTIMVSDYDGNILYCNARVEEVFGFPLDEVQGGSVEMFVPPGLIESHRERREIYRNNPVTHPLGHGDFLWLTKNGELVPVDLASTPIQYDNKEAILVTVRDISEIRSAQKSMEQMAAIVEASGDAIFRTSLEGIVQFWSRGAEQLYGYKAGEVMNKSLDILIPGGGGSATNKIRNSLSKGEGVAQHDTLRVHKNGQLIEVSVSVFPILSSQGEIIGGAAIHRDIREMKHLQEQLRYSQKMETAGQLAGGIAHDFNNILTVIQGYCSLILEDLPKDSPLLGQLKAIESAALRASSLTRQLLAISRKQRVDPKVINPKLLIQELLTGIYRTLGEDITIQTNLNSSWKIKEDPAQFEQIFLNLLVNARQAMPDGGEIKIETCGVNIRGKSSWNNSGEISFSPEPVKAGSYFLLSITDNGVGMSAEVLERIFEPFYTTKPRGEGTGLGLSVAYGMVTQSGGAIHVETSIGNGTCFYVFLPRALSVPEAEIESKAQLTIGMGEILLVEDDVDVRHLSKAILEAAGYTVTTASAPGEVLEGDYNAYYDLILSDVVMPGMSGPEFAKVWLRRHPKARFLFMSGYADDAILPFAFSSENLIQKPFKSDELIRRVAVAIER